MRAGSWVLMFSSLVGCALFSNETIESEGVIAKIFTPTGSGKEGHEDSKELVRVYLNSIQSADYEKIKSYLAESYQVTNYGDIQTSTYSKFTEGSKNIVVRVKALHRALFGFTIDKIEMIAEKDQVFCSFQISGVQKETFFGIAPTNKPILLKQMNVFRIKEGKIEEIKEMWNELSIMKQLGFIVL